ncbi:MAG: hypothetical protein COA96_16700 [SAR86 cluster bacterium]|uniref:Nucleotide-diphospho-sugar transferase domain-containing protein n=1 Tax=SAR86 cluster bacterium TaxID=2030880 RepID=A0A2A5AG86_9GAMM|nr:MAG: hypothetical protein COA96_16700 [SAR86 cluster bacterium]
MMFAHYFGDSRWRKLARAWEYSAGINCPSAEISLLEEAQPSGEPWLSRGYKPETAWNTIKLRAWRDAVNDNAGKDIVLMDADTLVLGDLAPAFVHDFDIGYTPRPGRHPLNGGVVFVRGTDAAIQFINDWYDRNMKIMNDADNLRRLLRKYGGVNQASLGLLLKESSGVRFRKFDCIKWNSVDETWQHYDGTANVVHYKGALREMLFMDEYKQDGSPMVRLANLWKCMSGAAEPQAVAQ